MGNRSNDILSKPEWCFNRSVFKAVGFSDDDLSRPVIGIANSWNELVPGHANLRQIAEHVRKGIYRAGGAVAEFGVIGACDGTAQGHAGMHYILPSRDLIANDIEIMVEAHRLDGIVLLGSCDKIVPGMLMAAARLKIPAIFLAGGPMLGGVKFDGRKSDLTTMSEALGMLKSDKIDGQTYEQLEELCGPTCGSCAFYGTANTMCCMAEALGMSLPGAALVPAVYADRLRLAENTGKAIVALVTKEITADKVISYQSLENAIRVLMATGGSTNAVLHLSAIAAELGIEAETMMEAYDRLSQSTPQIAKVNPASQYDMEDFHQAGGIPKVMQEIKHLLHEECITVTGNTVKQNLADYKFKYPCNHNVISTLDKPFSIQKGLAILRGNLAPATAVTKPAAIDPAMHVFTGSAKVFDCEEAAEEAILSGKIATGDVVVIRYEGPKGGPGMREMYKAMKYIYGMGLAKKTALITDGRFSGTNNGCFVGHISPEAAEGGPLAAVENGDKITIDITKGLLHLHLADEEIKARLEKWQRPQPKFTHGYLGIYSKLASSAAKGAVMKL
ncbi:dihydroxy-acid dehydratase [Sporomusa acidovorans]|uniref:Dihydroxy-acid dehydratase n=1 Tax=Sporomusa acidovorans (strain ATCC 49682 / DSM 3132 / Mol) TaxID=1123286 RepID=A0ABZ3IXG7_SPOA4|nr:dihydroxy-acid dehydratase [Sporomusa acidovorans]OZC22366.1 dihydroxy-acid dehydratase [Sporomusa acidovorans DSM 3132]SDE46940.1 dihydroxyacid dehydratase [Sporomusa acidovorans]